LSTIILLYNSIFMNIFNMENRGNFLQHLQREYTNILTTFTARG
jgi:hypothetical protein